MFDAVLVANRGEIALRIIRALRELDVRSVAVYSEADRHAPHVRAADEAYLLGPAPAAESYLSIEKILQAAQQAEVDAIHPGYGFLAENADFARAVADAGLVFIGPPAEAIAAMGDKLSARRIAHEAGVPVVPGTDLPADAPDTAALRFGEQHGYPIAVKAVFGGGGRGMKVARSPEELLGALESAQREARAAFGRGECYLERYLERPRHVEVQVLADQDGTTVHLGDRDCSLQRRHQKLVEEAPAPGISQAVREAMTAAAVRLAQHIDYVNAGTCEFLVEGDQFYFLEMNTRLQVEHPVTELVTGVDLVHAQLRIAAGDGMGITQEQVSLRGHAIEARINAEDPANGFVPMPGVLADVRLPQGPGIRFDGTAEAGYEVPREYDSMIGKLVVWAKDRNLARARMARALDDFAIEGIGTTLPFHKVAMSHPQFVAAEHTTISVEQEWDLPTVLGQQATSSQLGEMLTPIDTYPQQVARDVELNVGERQILVTVYGRTRVDDCTAAVPRRRAHHSQQAGPGGEDGPAVRAPMQGVVVKYLVAEGAQVEVGDVVCVVEAMKMENPVRAHRSGTLVEVAYADGDSVEQGAVLAQIT
jgi:acetyl-CoA/propionyl-CoA carboxylase biotin carboxyl carrier protein